MKKLSTLLFLYVSLATGLTSGLASAGLALPVDLQGKVEVLQPDDKDYAQADLAGAVKPAGQGGISAGLVVRLIQDLPVYRMWNGPDKLDASGLTNRMGQWWSFDAPCGTRAKYRANYEICQAWNDLTWVATCGLKMGTVVAIGPGQSVSADDCGDPTGQESYFANPIDWQVFIAKAWSRGDELVCPPVEDDYQADPANVGKPLVKSIP